MSTATVFTAMSNYDPARIHSTTVHVGLEKLRGERMMMDVERLHVGDRKRK
jgi:hypothetical protein